MKKDESIYQKEYSESNFWDKTKSVFKVAGIEVINKALLLYYATENPNTPLWAKTAIYAALGYFISPIDAIPDLTPILGYSDDLGVLVAALATVTRYIDDTVKSKTAVKIEKWFSDKN